MTLLDVFEKNMKLELEYSSTKEEIVSLEKH